ncbi:endonuclease/exonuclease/phosphatase family domain-containing protein 1-like isoform X2 [Thrips palmi]|nr:endonuclease/exonuclease/phosphatase family domain-containing protein 1-like isoform X2 [Thrips palmi]
MGQSSSVPLGGRNKSFRSSWRSPFPHRNRACKGNLSATFNVLDVDTKIDQLNVNLASEEELMTLPDISRADAHNIVEYRQRLGRFKKVEDLALVSGIGADKLALIRPEICVAPRRSPSCASSRAQSTDSIHSVDSKPLPRPVPLLNINTATVFELQAIPGFTQEIAANVIDYRDTHGNFSTLDHLTKVKGINHIRLGAVRARLTACSENAAVPVRNGYASSFNVVHGTPKSSPKLTASHSSQPIANGKISGHRKTMSVPVKLGPTSNGLAVRDILDVLSACSPRPIVEDHFDGKRKGRPAIRMATWNLSGLSLEKAENPGVKEVICRTILENRFSLVALQDVLRVEALEKICNELNFPCLRRIKDWKENSRRWHHQSCKGLGFLWDANDGVALSAINMIKLLDSDDLEVLHADFMVGNHRISLVNIHFQEPISNESQNEILSAVQKQLTKDQNDKQIIVGDFSFPLKNTEDCALSVEFDAVLPPSVVTNSIALNHHSGENPFNDNIYLNKTIQKQFTDMSGVVRQGLTHLAIPYSWSWGGPASEHCPVWCELYVEKMPLSTSPTKQG